MIYKDIEASFIEYTEMLLKRGFKAKESFFRDERKKLKEQYIDNEKEYHRKLDKLIEEIRIQLDMNSNGTDKPRYKRTNKQVDKNVHHPKHYNTGKFEVIEVINDWKLNFELGNVIKYVARADHKGNRKEDLNKALFYLEYEIKKCENGLK